MKIRREALPFCLAALLFFYGPWLRPARAQLLGLEFQVNSYTTNGQSEVISPPAVAADGLGNFVVVWDSAAQDGSLLGVFGQRFNSTGSPVASEFRVNSYTTSYQRSPAVAEDSSGNFVVVWESYNQFGLLSFTVHGQRFNSTGIPVGSEFLVNNMATGNQRFAAVAADGSGNFVVAWAGNGQDGSSYGVFGRRYDSAGVPLGSEFQVNTYTTNSQWRPAVAADGVGNFVVAWQSYGQDGSHYGVFGQRFNSAGTPVGSEFQVNTYTTNLQAFPAVSADGQGNFVVVWDSNGQDGSDEGVFGQRFDSVGSPLGSEFQVNSYTTSWQTVPAAAADTSGNFVVVWGGNGQDGPGWGVFGQRFNSAGIPVGSEFQVNTYTTSNQSRPAVATDGLGRFVVAWPSYGQDGSGYGVFGQRLSPVASIFSDGFDLGDACAWSAVVGGGCP